MAVAPDALAAPGDLRRRHAAVAGALAPEMLERLGWSPERLAAHRSAGLRRLVARARRSSPWHRRRLAGVELTRLDERTLAELPPMTKADLMGNFDEIVTDRRIRLDSVESHLAEAGGDAYLLGRYHALASGGSSGRRGVFVSDWEAWARRWLGFWRFELATGAHQWRRPLIVGGVGPAPGAPGFRALIDTFFGPAHTTFSVTEPVAGIVAGLNRLRPTVLSGYPSALAPLADEAGAGRLRIRPKRVVTGAEPLLPETRRALAEAWGAPVRNWYGCSEAGPLAVDCGRGRGLHLTEDLVILEPVDEAGRAVVPGRRAAKLYLTNLYDPVLPLIRYELTDEVTVLSERCPCGCAMRLVADPQGRFDDTFSYGPVRVHPHVFRSALARRPEVVEYQVHQTAAGADVVVRCRAPLEPQALAGDLAGALRRLGLAGAQVTVTPVECIERQAAGKLKRFVPLPTPEPAFRRAP